MPYISKRNRQALVIVIFISILIVYIPRILMILEDSSSSIQISQAEIQETRNKISEYQKSKKKYTKFYSKKNKKSKYKFPPSKFDPNEYSLRDWMQLGLSEKQANVVLKFTSRGINSNEDLQRVFVISDELYEMIKDSTYYSVAEKIEITQKVIPEHIEKPKLSIELNAASQEELMKIKGIGESFAKWIINYRTRLGGFSKKEQLLEVWKMDIDKFSQIESFIALDENKIVKIKLNAITVEELKNHPYLNWNKANSIIKIRDRKKGFQNIEEIKESVLIDEECFEKLKPYLSL
jgi:competence ComEA-like helix-hairpin-helix protein